MAQVFAVHEQKIHSPAASRSAQKNIEALIEQLSALRTLEDQPLDLTLTNHQRLKLPVCKAQP
jgi:hypothetical protein